MIRRYGATPRNDQNYQLRAGVYAILPRRGQLLLTWQGAPHNEVQLPGGGIDPGESPIHALHREVFEETGLTIYDISYLDESYKHKQFFCASFPRDDIRLSEEHHEYKFIDIKEIQTIENLAPYYRKAILKCAGHDVEIATPRIKIIIGH